MTNEKKEINELLDEEQDTFDGDELSLDDLQGNWLKNPKIGEEIQFTIKRIVKTKNIDCKTREGKKFTKNLSKVDYAIEIHTEDNKIYTVTAWEVFGKVKAILKQKERITGVEFRIKHLKNGMTDKGGDTYDVLVNNDGKWQRYTTSKKYEDE